MIYPRAPAEILQVGETHNGYWSTAKFFSKTSPDANQEIMNNSSFQPSSNIKFTDNVSAKQSFIHKSGS